MTYTLLMALTTVFGLAYVNYPNEFPIWARPIVGILGGICYISACSIADKRERKLVELEKRIKELEEK